MKKEPLLEDQKAKKTRLNLSGQQKHDNIKGALNSIRETLEQLHLDTLEKLRKK